MLTSRIFSDRADMEEKRRGFMLADLLFASALALATALIVLQSTSMLVKQSRAAKEYHDDAYAFAALIEEVIADTEGGVADGKMGWQAEVQPSSTPGVYAPALVKIRNTREKTEFPLLVWKSWRGSAR